MTSSSSSSFISLSPPQQQPWERLAGETTGPSATATAAPVIITTNPTTNTLFSETESFLTTSGTTPSAPLASHSDSDANHHSVQNNHSIHRMNPATVTMGAPDPAMVLATSRSFETITDTSSTTATTSEDDDAAIVSAIAVAEDDDDAYRPENGSAEDDDDDDNESLDSWSDEEEDPAGDAISLQDEEEEPEEEIVFARVGGNENTTLFQPDDDPEEQQSLSTRSNSDTGIPIPSFLQPLLGLNFVPFLPKNKDDAPKDDAPQDTTTTTMASRHPINLAQLEKEEDEENWVSMMNNSSSNGNSSHPNEKHADETSLETNESTAKASVDTAATQSTATMEVNDEKDLTTMEGKAQEDNKVESDDEEGEETKKKSDDKMAWKVRRRQRRQKWRGKRFVSSASSDNGALRTTPAMNTTISSSSLPLDSEKLPLQQPADNHMTAASDEDDEEEEPIGKGARGAIAKRIQKIQAARRKQSESKGVDAKEKVVVTPVTSKDEDEDDDSCDSEVETLSPQPISPPEGRIRTAESPSFSRVLAAGRASGSSWRTPQSRPRSSLTSTPLAHRVRNLTSLRRQAKVVRLRAGNIEERVASLQDEADALILALQQTEAQLLEEEEMLKITEGELKDVEDKCLVAVQTLQDEIVQARRDQEADTVARTFPSARRSPSPRPIENDEEEERLEDGAITAPASQASSWVTTAAATASIARTMFTTTATVTSPPVSSNSRPSSPVVIRRSVSPSPFSSRTRSSTPPPFPRSRSSSSLLKIPKSRSPPSLSQSMSSDSSPQITTRPPRMMFRRARADSAPPGAMARAARAAVLESSKESFSETRVERQALQTPERSLEPKEKIEVIANVLPLPTATAASLGTTFSGHTHIRLNDLEIDHRGWSLAPESLIESFPNNKLNKRDLFLMEDMGDLKIVLKQLSKLGLETVTDEREERFNPTWETQRALKQNVGVLTEEQSDWPYAPWYEIQDFDSVLVWAGSSQYNGFGHGWPLIKARGNVRTSARNLLDFLLDLNQMPRYNKSNVAREYLTIFQSGVDTIDDDGKLEGDARIMRVANKPKLLSKTLESTCLCYSQPLPDGAYMVVNRSIWEEDEKETPTSSVVGSNVIRCEILLGVQLIRPTQDGNCELTTISHMYSPGIPILMAKRMAPSVSAGLIRDIQRAFGG